MTPRPAQPAPSKAQKAEEVCPEVDLLVKQLATGKGEFFDYVDDGPSQVDGVWGRSLLRVG